MRLCRLSEVQWHVAAAKGFCELGSAFAGDTIESKHHAGTDGRSPVTGSSRMPKLFEADGNVPLRRPWQRGHRLVLALRPDLSRPRRIDQAGRSTRKAIARLSFGWRFRSGIQQATSSYVMLFRRFVVLESTN